MNDIINGISMLAAGISSPLKADMQFMEPYASTALNRKLKNILKPGVYSGFIPVPGKGLAVIITPDTKTGEGAASVDVNDVQITVNQRGAITVPVKSGTTSVIALEANYQFGVKTTQVDGDSTVPAAQILAIVGASLGSNQIELCRVKVPSGATQVTADMIIQTSRTDREVGVAFSSDTDSDEERKAATPLAVKKVRQEALLKNNNLSDLPDAEEARNNLSLGSAARKNTGNSGDTVPLLNGENTWGAFQTFDKGINVTGDATASGGVKGYILKSSTIVSVFGEADFSPSQQGGYLGWNRTSGGGRLDLICHKGGGAGGCDIWNGNSQEQKVIATVRDGLLAAISPFASSGTKGDINYGSMVASALNGNGADRSPFEKGAVFGHRIKEIVGSGHLGLFALEGFGGTRYWEMRSDGTFFSGETLISGSEVHAGNGSARMASDGNIYGPKWGGWLSEWLERNFLNRANKSQNGWSLDVSTGIITQWGRVPVNNIGFNAVVFPIAFPDSCFSISCTVDRGDARAGADNWSAVRNVTRFGFSAGNDEHGAYWIAIGC